ncbi:MAG: hypothetical protein J5636_09080 [Clostridiales bacterium]|nr:hypothetical protein [Clostridiales bacterium]
MEDCLVYFFTGFLDAGKTSFIQSWIGDGSFQDKRVLIILTEEGEVELPPEEKAPCKAMKIVTAETEEVTRAFTYILDAKFKPDVVLIEWNGSVSPSAFFDVVDVPDRWMLCAAICIVDASTYNDYYRNMQTMFADYYRFCDNVIFNRVDPEVNNIPKLRGSVKSLNPGMNLSFFGMDGNMIDIGNYLPYNLDDDPCVIAPDDFGLFYTDALDNVKRYNGKRITVTGQATLMKEHRDQAFVLQRQAYTCCANDIGMISMLCLYKVRGGFPAGKWLSVTGKIGFFRDDSQGNPVAIPCLQVENFHLTDKPKNEIIYFS